MKVSAGRNHHCLLPHRNELERFGPLLGLQLKTKLFPLTHRSVSPWCARL